MKTFRNIAFGLVLGFGTTVWAQANIFPDVDLTDWFYPYVNEIKDWGIVSGNDDGTFAPARNINRAEFSKMLVLYDGRVDQKIVEATSKLMTPPIIEPGSEGALPSVMHLEINNTTSEPPMCPENWTEIALQRRYNLNGDNLRRTCMTDQQCEVLYLEDRQLVADCPAGWSEANSAELNSKNSQRVCYVCAE